MTDTRFTTYIDQMSAWYDKKTGQEILNLKLWQQLKVGGQYIVYMSRVGIVYMSRIGGRKYLHSIYRIGGQYWIDRGQYNII